MGRIDSRMGFLRRLASDVRGNTLAMMAAAMIPLAGLIGGGVDMSRLYLVKTRLQQACDAGALAGRKAMAAGSWLTGVNNNSTNDKAEKMFAANFASGQYGTNNFTKAYSESNGNVNGTSTVHVPMTIMKIFGMRERTLTVNCTAKMELPNTDVMFVLDVTLSMTCLPSATTDSCGTAPAGSQRIDGLKKAVKCFYEALEKVATPEPCTLHDQGDTNPNNDVWDSASDPTATTATTTAQVRIGFVPYGVNVNVGKILPNSVIADNWVYQSRAPNKYPGTLYGWTLGTETAISGNWSSPPTDLYDQSKYSTWQDISTNGGSTVSINGVNVTKRPSGYNSTTCPGLNTKGPNNNKTYDIVDTGNVTDNLQSTTPNPPVHPATQQVLTYNSTDSHTVTAYKYAWVSNSCRLQKPSNNRTYSLTRNGGTLTKPITWTPYTDVFKDWTYKPRLINVSGLKNGGSNWNNSITIPDVATTSGFNVKLSGSNSNTSIKYLTDTTVTWDGCIEEAKTYRNTDNNPSDEWGAPLRTDAWDVNVNLIPNATSTGIEWGTTTLPSENPHLDVNNLTDFSPGTFWGPMLAKTNAGVVWTRYPSGSGYSNWTSNSVTTANNLTGYTYVCTSSPARKLQEYRTNTDFLSYVNNLDADDRGTYHDIGMLWGARLLSPTGIFAADNAQASTGGAIQRHLIFMTDGNTRSVQENYNAYGLAPVAKYQFQNSPNETRVNDLINARLQAICRQVRKMNITIWVVSYGASVNDDNADRLKACATDDDHFFNAKDTSTLMSSFQTIAAKISELRLTS